MIKEQFLDETIKCIDSANIDDPNTVFIDGIEWKKEQIYSMRMSEMLLRFHPGADEVGKIAVHAQHIQRWKYPRSDYPMDRKGYFQWRTYLYSFHADTVATLMEKVGYAKDTIKRVKNAVGKKDVNNNEDAQLVEDIAALVFIEYYMQDFVNRHPEYSEEKWLRIIRKTWSKMSPTAQQFALSQGVKLPNSLIPLIFKAVTEE